MEGTGRPGAIRHIAALDGARGLAVAGVLLFHGGHLLGGYLGVDFFFTLSGFLITSLLLAEAGRTGSVGLGGFWARRARRLLPALAVLMIGVALYSVTLAKPVELTQIRGDAFATLGYVANWHEIFSHTSYFALFNAPSPLNHTWSLAIEEQFYVIWPLLFVALLTRFKRATPKAVLVTSLGLAAVSSVLMIVLYDPTNSNRVYFGTDTRAAAILFGAALAAALAVYGPATKRNTRVALESTGLAGAVVLAIAWTRLDGQSSTLYRGGFLLCGLAATAIIAAATHPEPGPIARVLSLKWLCALGLISYGVYLYHWPIDVALNQQRAHTHGWPLFALQTLLTLTIAIASYRFIEQPIRHGALSPIQWRKLTPTIAIALAIALIATTNTPPPALTRLEGGTVVAATLTRLGAAPGAQRIMIVGDSVASTIGPAFKAIQAHPPIAVFDIGIRGCVFPPEVVRGSVTMPDGERVKLVPCHPPYEARVERSFRPKVVFWIMSTGAAVGGTYQGHRVAGCSRSFESIYEQSLGQEIQRLGSGGAKVVITTAASANFPDHRVRRAEDDCENRMRRAVAAANGAQLVDLFSYICPHGKCHVKQDGVTLRPDGLHYDGPGGVIVAQWLYDQVRALK